MEENLEKYKNYMWEKDTTTIKEWVDEEYLEHIGKMVFARIHKHKQVPIHMCESVQECDEMIQKHNPRIIMRNLLSGNKDNS